jgi:hypothetical protein
VKSYTDEESKRGFGKFRVNLPVSLRFLEIIKLEKFSLNGA